MARTTEQARTNGIIVVSAMEREQVCLALDHALAQSEREYAENGGWISPETAERVETLAHRARCTEDATVSERARVWVGTGK